MKDGEEVEVFGWVNIQRHSLIRGSNPVVDHGEADIGAGDGRRDPDAVTHWVAEEVQSEFDIDVRDHGIDVVDPTAEEVDVL